MEVLRTRLCEWRPNGIDALAFAPAVVAGVAVPEPRLAVGRSNGAVELWDTTTWHLHSSSPGCARNAARDFVWAAGGGDGAPQQPLRLFSAGLPGEVIEWDMPCMRPHSSVSSGGGAVWALCSAAGRVCAACDDGTLRLFSLGDEPGGLAFDMRISVGKVRLFSAAGYGTDFVFAGGSDSRITKWSLSQKTCEGNMTLERTGGADTLVWALVCVGDNGLVSGDSLGLVQVWDPVTCIQMHRFAKHQADVLTLAAGPRGDVVLSGGIDTRISVFAHQAGADERWVYSSSEGRHTHDIRAIAVDDAGGPGVRSFASGGVAGRLVSNAVSCGDGLVTCSEFSPIFQTASVAQSSRLMLCQRDDHLELWYLQPPKVKDVPAGHGGLLPEGQHLIHIRLGSKPEGQHLTASAIAADGQLFVASDLSGSRLFRLNLEELQVHRERKLPQELQTTAARALLFCGLSRLALAAWSTHEVIVTDVVRRAIVARFNDHKAPVSHLATAREWLASADVSGTVHIFNLDSLRHHTRVPVGAGSGPVTALGFDARCRHLIVALANHTLVIFNVEKRAFAAGLPSPVALPSGLGRHQRVCGLAAPPDAPHKLLLWGHGFLLRLALTPWADDGKLPDERGSDDDDDEAGDAKGNESLRSVDAEGACVWHLYSGGDFRHILSLCALDRAQWGPPLLPCNKALLKDGEPDCAAEPPTKKRRGNSEYDAMVLTLEVSPEAAGKALPEAFERKKFVKNRRRGAVEGGEAA